MTYRLAAPRRRGLDIAYTLFLLCVYFIFALALIYHTHPADDPDSAGFLFAFTLPLWALTALITAVALIVGAFQSTYRPRDWGVVLESALTCLFLLAFIFGIPASPVGRLTAVILYTLATTLLAEHYFVKRR